MPDILHDFPIQAPASTVFAAITSPAGLDQWWTLRSAGEPRLGATYELFFGAEYDWRARVSRCTPNAEFELEMTGADADWLGTRVGFRLEPDGNATKVQFWHRGWHDANAHYRTSNCCWAMYLRILRRHIEHGEIVEYDRRLDV
jgi:uncharacterized protein YndB with AHSA1/START domain